MPFLSSIIKISTYLCTCFSACFDFFAYVTTGSTKTLNTLKTSQYLPTERGFPTVNLASTVDDERLLFLVVAFDAVPLALEDSVSFLLVT